MNQAVGPMRALLRKAAATTRGLLVRTGGDKLLSELTVGAPVRSIRARLAPSHEQYTPPTYRTVIRNGIRFELDVSDYMQWCAYYGIAIEPRETLYGLAGPGQVVFDVGTNVGEVLLNFARLVGESGQVFGLEINPTTYQRCLRNVSLNPYRNIQLHDVGFGRAPGELFLGRPDQRNSGADRVTDQASQNGTRVKVTTMDDFAREHGLARLDLIKIDVEGFEMNVLRGGEATLRRFRPRLFVELDDDNLRRQGSSARELVAWLEGLGYRLTHAEQGTAVQAQLPFEHCHFDVIARPADPKTPS